MAFYVDNFSCQEELPARPVRHRQDAHLNKTAVNKGVWEFRELRHAREAAAPAFTDAAEDNHPGSLWSSPPQIVKAIP